MGVLLFDVGRDSSPEPLPPAAVTTTWIRASGARYSFCPGFTSKAAYQASELRTASGAELPRRVAVGDQLAAQRLRALLAAPGLAESDEEPLVAGEPVELGAPCRRTALR